MFLSVEKLIVMNSKDNKNINKQKLGENDIIQKCIGTFGRWHLWVFFLACLEKIPVAFHQLNILVLAPKVDFWCENPDIPKCSSNCSKRIFDKSTFSNTITMQWDLVCDKQYLESTAQTIAMLGTLLGGLILGYLSDRFGRKTLIVWSSMLQLVAGVSSAFVPWFYVFLVLRFLTNFASGGTLVVDFVLIMEIIGIRWRTKFGILYTIPFNLGHILIPTISYFLRDWQDFQLATSVISVVFISYFWILPESPRWQLAVGENDKAINTMVKAAKRNNLPGDEIEHEVNNYVNNQSIKNTNLKKGNLFDLLRTPIIRKYTIVLWINWLACGLSYFGSSQYIGQLQGDLFLNLGLSAVIQIPGVILCCWVIDLWGRKTTLIVFNFICGITLITSGFMTDDPNWIKPTLSSIGISCSVASFATVFVYASEIFPTFIRNVGLGSSTTFSRIGSMVAPFIANLTFGFTWVPPVIFGIAMIIGAVLCSMMPDTLNCKLPDTVEDVENYEKTKRKN